MAEKLAQELRRRFAYAIDKDSLKFSPILASGTILNPKICALLPKDLFDAGKKEIERWFFRIQTSTVLENPVPINSSMPFDRLAAKQRLVVTEPSSELNR